MKLHLIRDIDTGNETLGNLYADDEWICYTIERPWKDNERRISCLPIGTYSLTTKEYGRFYDRYKLPIPILGNTEPRSEILIHPANYARELAGCIGVGSKRTDISVLNSRKTWFKLLPIFSECTEIWIQDIHKLESA